MEMFILLASLHFGEGRHDYETFTPGVGGYITENVAVLLYHNSIDANSIGVYYDTRWPSYSSRVVIGAASGYDGVDTVRGIKWDWADESYKGVLPQLSLVHDLYTPKYTIRFSYTLPAVVSVGVAF